MPKILIVEDDRDIRETLAKILVGLGHEVETAADGVRALGMLREGRTPDIIVLDLTMPNLDGYRFREIQRADERVGTIPIVVITADRRADAALLGAICIPKPFEPDTLVAAIEATLARAVQATVSVKQ